MRVYLDTAYERGTADFYGRTIKPALMASRWLIVIATPDAARRRGDDWIAREIGDFCNGPNGENVIVVRGRGALEDPLPAGLVERFAHVQIVDLRRVGRLWYLNPTRAARISNEFLKLVASVLDVEPHDMPALRQEEERRQQTRLGVAFGSATGIAVSVIALAAFALTSRYQTQAALRDSIFALSQLVQQGYETPDLMQPESTRGQIASRGCDLLSKLDGIAGERASVESRSLCLIVQGDGFALQREFDPAEAAYRAALALVEQQQRLVPTEAIIDAGLMARDAIVRLQAAKGDEAGQVRELEGLLGEYDRLMSAERPTTGDGLALPPEDGSTMRLQIRIARTHLMLADIYNRRQDAGREHGHLNRANKAFAGAIEASDVGTINQLRDEKAETEIALAKATEGTASLHHVREAIALRARIAKERGASIDNAISLAQLQQFLAQHTSDADDRLRLLDEARNYLREATARDGVDSSRRHATEELLLSLDGGAESR